jgi:hypothetical protein
MRTDTPTSAPERVETKVRFDVLKGVLKVTVEGVLESREGWLFLDERGTFERNARWYWEETAAKRAELGMTNPDAVVEIADRIALLALTAFLRTCQARRKARKRRG